MKLLERCKSSTNAKIDNHNANPDNHNRPIIYFVIVFAPCMSLGALTPFVVVNTDYLLREGDIFVLRVEARHQRGNRKA